MIMRSLVAAIFFLCLIGCSFTHNVRMENRSTTPVTIAYKLNSFNNAPPGLLAFFAARPGIARKHGKEFVPDTSVRMNPMDSVVTFVLAPGDRAWIAHCMNCTYEGMSKQDGYAYHRMNMQWLSVTRNGTSTSYTPLTLMQLVKKNKLQETLLVIEEAV